MLDFITNFLFPVLSVLIPVFVTLYTVDNRIKARNRENHQPYVILERISRVKKFDDYSYHLTPVGKNYLDGHNDINYDELKDKDYILVNLDLHNIGYGVATNIKFYSLLTGLQVHGDQKSNPYKDQKLFTTLDMESSEEKQIQTRIIKSVGKEKIEDEIRMLCVYRDLNDNIYDFIISINAKKNNHYDFFAYEPSSKSYKRCKSKYVDNYNKIMADYKN